MLRIAFVCAEPDISGGINVIYRHVMGLLASGAQVAIVHNASVRPEQLAWHPIGQVAGHPNLLWLDYASVAHHQFDIAVATWWRSFFDLWKVNAKSYVYFVQSVESRFYASTEHVVRAAVEATYEAPIGYITEADWICDYLGKVHRQKASLAPNGIDKLIFSESGEVISPRQAGRLRVLVEGPTDVGFKNVEASIRLARDAAADEVWLLTSSSLDSHPGVDRVFSRVRQSATGPIYRSCDLVLKLSLVEGMFGPPLEMFHCGGTAIVYNVTGHDQYIRHGHNALVADMHDERAVKLFIRQLKSFPPLLEALKLNARATADAWPDWPESTQRFQTGLREAARRSHVSREDLGRFSRQIWHFVESHWREMAAFRDDRVETSPPPMKLYGEQIDPTYILELESRIATMLQSTSWRLTRPMRGAKRLVTEPGFATMMLKAFLSRYLHRRSRIV